MTLARRWFIEMLIGPCVNYRKHSKDPGNTSKLFMQGYNEHKKTKDHFDHT